MKKLCYGEGKPVHDKDKIFISNPIPSDDPTRLTHWDTMFDGDKRQLGVKRIRLQCKICKRRLWASVSVCGDGCHVIFSMPPHKPKGWWKKRIKINKKKRKRR